ncbi:MAG: hypothetical protein ACK5LP_03965 [Campylobacteraceae bacterium]
MKKFLIVLVLPFILFGQSLKVGDTLSLNIEDQFEKNVTIGADTKQLIIASSKKVGEEVAKFIEKNPNYLNENSAIYIMDVVKVPKLVMSMFMMPKFKKYNYSVGLVKDEKVAETLPKEENSITIIKLQNLQIESIEFKKSL